MLKQIEELKKLGGPFTNTTEIDDFLGDNTIEKKAMIRRMKTEVMYARDTSLSVPKSNPVFRIRSLKVHGKKSHQLTPAEFGANLKILMDKKIQALDKNISIKVFVDKLDAMKNP